MSAIVTTRVNGLGGESATDVLSGMWTAILVNTALCVVTLVLVAASLPRTAGRPQRVSVRELPGTRHGALWQSTGSGAHKTSLRRH